MITFACISPHPPLILPTVGSAEDRAKVKATISSLESLAPTLSAAKPELIIISSPHPDWGIQVPAHFLLAKMQKASLPIHPFLTTLDSPKQHYEWGKEIAQSLLRQKRGAWISSGDMSHRLKEDGPYGLHPSGPKFDQKFIELLEKKDIKGILNLDPEFLEEAGECGLRSFCMLLGALEWQSRLAGLKPSSAWEPEILSYEGPFGVGYLVANFKIGK
jgi:aromatic ring-opening dioxygenase LigB subunit